MQLYPQYRWHMFDISASRMSQMQVHRDAAATTSLNRTKLAGEQPSVASFVDPDYTPGTCSNQTATPKGAVWEVPQGKHIAWAYVAVGIIVTAFTSTLHESVVAFMLLLSSSVYTPIAYTHAFIVSSTRSLCGACATLAVTILYQFFAVFTLLTIHSHTDEETDRWPQLLCLLSCYSFLFTVCSQRNYCVLFVTACASLSVMLVCLNVETDSPIALMWAILLCVSLITAHVIATWSLPIVIMCNKTR